MLSSLIDFYAYSTLIVSSRLHVDYLISSMRKRIESAFSEISNLLPKKIHAVTEFGFLLKLVIFIFGYAI